MRSFSSHARALSGGLSASGPIMWSRTGITPNARMGPAHQNAPRPVAHTTSHDAATSAGTTAPSSHRYLLGSFQLTADVSGRQIVTRAWDKNGTAVQKHSDRRIRSRYPGIADAGTTTAPPVPTPPVEKYRPAVSPT